MIKPLILREPDLEWIERGYAEAIGDAQSPGSMFDLRRTFTAHASRARGCAAQPSK